MNLSWTPFQDMTVLQSDPNRLFGSAFKDTSAESEDSSTCMPTDICETDSELVVITDMPGMDPRNIVVRVENSVLTIRGRRFEQLGRQHFHRVERSRGPFARSFTLAAPVDPDNLIISYKDGVLRILLPKSEEARPNQIQMTAVA
jgi:HSP20 family protein